MKQYPTDHNSPNGLVESKRRKASDTVVSIYRASLADLDPTGGEYVTVCEEHNTLCNHETLALAKSHAVYPEWCGDCQPNLVRQ